MTTATAPTPAEARELLERARKNPRWFCTRMLGLTLYEKQFQMLESVRDNPQTSVVGANSTGKDYCTGRAVIPWWMSSHERAVVVIIGPTTRQVEEIVWRHTRQAFHEAPVELPGRMYPQQAKWEVADDHFAIGFATDHPYNITGFHSPHLLVVITEAHAVSDAHMTMVKRLNPERIVLTGNAFSDAGEFFDSHHGKRHLWNAITIKASDSPNVQQGRDDVMPGLVSQRDIDRYAADWGEESPLYRATVNAEFVGSPDGLIPLSALQAARLRTLRPVPDRGGDRITVGIDVAGTDDGGDETVVYVVQGADLLAWNAWRREDPYDEVAAFLAPYRQTVRVVNVDKNGVGVGMLNHLRREGWPVHGVNVGLPSTDPERYANLKAQLYWALRQRFMDGHLNGLTDEVTMAQLSGIRYTGTARGQIAIERKVDIKKRGLASPDRAEALMLAYASGAGVAMAREEQKRPAIGVGAVRGKVF